MLMRSVLLVLLAVVAQPSTLLAQVSSAAPDRAIRHDIPLTNAILRAFEAGTRDSTGRPGPNYWQLRTDYTIEASIDPATQTITGRETIVIKNSSDREMPYILLRLDHNIFRDKVPRG